MENLPGELRQSIRSYTATLKAKNVAGMLSTYVIFDPTKMDQLHDCPFGEPFYVGQGHFSSRAKGHLRGTSGRPTRKRIAQIYEQGRYPLFMVVDHAKTRLASLYSEMAWACHLISLGYVLTNCWREHKKPEPLQLVPSKRVWPFSIEDAIADKIGLKVQCRACGLRLPLNLYEVARGDAAHIHLNDVRRTFMCPECSELRCLRVTVPVASIQVVPDFAGASNVWRSQYPNHPPD